MVIFDQESNNSSSKKNISSEKREDEKIKRQIEEWFKQFADKEMR